MQDRRNQRSSRLDLPKVVFPLPNPEEDCRTYERISESLVGVREMLEEYRSNEGRIGYGALNLAMGYQKASIAYLVRGEERDLEESDLYQYDMEEAERQIEEATLPANMAEYLNSGLGHALAQVGRDPKKDAIRQERVELKLVKIFWPVVTARGRIEVPRLPTVKEFGCHIQAVIAGHQDLPLELATRFDPYVTRNRDKISNEDEVFLFDRLIAIIDSIYQKLEEFNGVPGYVINNSFWRGSSFSNKQFRIKMLLIRQNESHRNRVREEKVRKEQAATLKEQAATLKRIEKLIRSAAACKFVR